jgi:1-acyl-sn-glycerol-3-phosphate acyltransferase
LGGDVEESRLADIYTVRDLIDAVRESAASGATTNKKPAQTFAGWGTVLREDPVDPVVLAVTKPHPFVDRMLFVVTRIIKLLWSIRAPVTIEGLENIPPRAPFLLCSNHQSFFDPVMLLAILPLRVLLRLFAVGTSEIFGSGFMRHIARILRVVVVDPDANLIPAMRAGAYGLRQGLSLILYPEGERSIDGTPRTIKKGAAILSIHLQVPIVPIAIEGFHDAWPRGKFFQKFSPLKMKIGKPIQPPPESQASEDAYAKLTTELKARVMEMWNELRDKKAEGKSA